MASGPIFPYSAIAVTSGKVFPNVHVGAGSNSKHEEGLGVMASLSGDAIWRLRFLMPPAIPTGTCKLSIWTLTGDTSAHVGKVNPKWVSVATAENPSTATLVAEGTSTITVPVSNNDKYVNTKITLDADTPTASEIIVMDLTFETSGWTISSTSTHVVAVIWE